MRLYCFLTVSILPWVGGLTFTPNSSGTVYNCTSFNAPNMGEWKEQEFSKWNEVDKPALLQFLTLDTYVCMFSFMFLNFKSLSEVRNQREEQQISVFANGIGWGSQGRYSSTKHLLNAYHVPDSLAGWCRDESQSLPSRVPVSSGETGQEPNKDNTERFRACCVKMDRRSLSQVTTSYVT